MSPEQADADKYDLMMQLADLFDATGDDLRERARLGPRILADDAVHESAELSPGTYERAEMEIRAATVGKLGLSTRSVELDADALVVRATVLTYRWIDELQQAAYKTLGSIAGRAIGYLAPQVALGGAIVSAGLIETDALDREDLATYLNDLAENNPGLMEHFTSGGGGLIESLQMRSLLAAGVLSGQDGPAAARGGLRFAGIEPLAMDASAALRDAAGGIPEEESRPLRVVREVPSEAPVGIEELMRRLTQASGPVSVERVGPGRLIAYLPGPQVGAGRLRLVSGDPLAYAAQAISAIGTAAGGSEAARVLLVGAGQGGLAAATIATRKRSETWVVDSVVTAGSPSSHVPRVPESVTVLSLEDRADPVALLGTLVNAKATHRTTVVVDGGGETGLDRYVVGGRVVDRSGHPELRSVVVGLRDRGFLSG